MKYLPMILIILVALSSCQGSQSSNAKETLCQQLMDERDQTISQMNNGNISDHEYEAKALLATDSMILKCHCYDSVPHK